MLTKSDKEFQLKVCERDNYTCQKPGKHHKDCKIHYNYPMYFDQNGRNLYVTAHHIKTKKAYPELRYDTDNGMTLSSQCHVMIHKGL